MPTTEQLRLRSEKISDWIKEIAVDKSQLLKVPYNLKVDVMAGGLAQGTITPDDVDSKVANAVALNFLKNTGDRTRDFAADKGTDVHNLADSITNGEVVYVPERLKGHIASWQQFRDFYDLDFVMTEFTVWSPTYHFAGTGDFLAYSRRFPELGLICGDYKTSESGIWPDIALQLAPIRYADFIGLHDLTEDRETLSKITTFWGVQITSKGYQVVPVTVNEAVFRVFLSATNIARWKRDFEQFALGKSEFISREITEDVSA